MTLDDGTQILMLQPAWAKSTTVAAQTSTSIVDPSGEKLRRRMPGKERRDQPSPQLMRLRALILQMEETGHPQWRDEQGHVLKKVSQAELARRTGLTPSYLNSIKYPDRSRNTDVGAAILAQLCEGVGLDVRYFYDGYEGVRPFVIYLLDKKREENQAVATERAISELRSEFMAVMGSFREEMRHREALHDAQVASLETELARARTDLLTVAGNRGAARPAPRALKRRK